MANGKKQRTGDNTGSQGKLYQKKFSPLKKIIICLTVIAIVIASVVLVRHITSQISGSEGTSQRQQVKRKRQGTNPSSQKTPQITVRKNSISLFLAGDALLHSTVYQDAQIGPDRYNFDKQLSSVTSIARKYDLEYYNQETILGGSSLGLSGYPTFNSPQQFGTYMVSQGFNLVSTANNHALDRGLKGIQNSRKFWNAQKGVLAQGTNSSQAEYDHLATMKVKGISLAFLSYTYGTNGITPQYPWEVNYYPGHEKEMLAKVSEAKKRVDLVIVAMHWGTEYAHEPNEEQKTLARKLSEAGAGIIIGNHVHTIQPFQWVGKTPVFYAMGNLISSQLKTDNLIGMIGSLTITKTSRISKTGSTSTVTVSNPTADLIYTHMVGTYPGKRSRVKVYTFQELNNSLLKNYSSLYKEYSARVRSMDKRITIGPLT